MEKISKERVGKEMQQALEHKNQLMYLNHLHNVGLLPVIFKSPKSMEAQGKLGQEELEEIFQNNSRIWTSASKLSETALEITENMSDIKERRLCFILSALLHNFVKHLDFREIKKANLLEYHIKISTKLSKKIMNTINSICLGMYSIRDLVESGSLDLENMGMLIRDIKGYWPYSVYLYGEVFADQEGYKTRDEILQMIHDANLASFYKTKCIINVNFFF